MTLKVMLHKDENMRLAKADDNQPTARDLWQMMVSDKYSNSVAFYQTLPDVYS